MERKRFIQERKFERFQTGTMKLDCEVCGQGRARIRDISFGGAGLLVDQPPEVGSTCVLGVETDEGRFKIVAEVVWVRGDLLPEGIHNDLGFSIGLRFDKGSMEAGKDLVFSIISKT